METLEETLVAAVACVQHYRWSVIPVQSSSKIPAVEWAEFQRRYASTEELERWFSNGRSNIGIVTGKLSGIVVIDIDGPMGEESLSGFEIPATVIVNTPRGRHLYFKHPGRNVKNAAGILPGVDVRGDGGYVVAPPSRFNGTAYAYTAMPRDVGLAPLPDWFFELADRDRGRAVTAPGADPGERLTEGERNDTLASIAGGLRAAGLEVDTIVAALLIENDKRCVPPLPEAEVRKIAGSIGRYEQGVPPADDGQTPMVDGWWIREASLEKPSGKTKYVEALPFAPVPEAVYRDEDNEIRGFKIRFQFSDADHVRTVVLPAEITRLTQAAGVVADAGGPDISTEHARVLVRFLADIAAGRGHNIAETRVITRAVWRDEVLSVPGVRPVGRWKTELAAYGGIATEDESRARSLWARALEMASGSDKSILVMGMPIGSIYVRPLQLDNFALHITAESSVGKTESAEVAMSALGAARKPRGKLYRTWDVSEQAPIALFRQVGCLPVWFDETAVLGDAERFSTIIFRLAQGTNRMRADTTGGLTEGSADRWDTCLLSTGEARITITSALSGMQRRVLEIEAPLTDRDSHEFILDNVRRVWGWPLRWLAQDPDVGFADRFHSRVMNELTGASRSQQVEISQAANIATCAMGFAVLCRLAGLPVPLQRILSAARSIFTQILGLAAEHGSDIGERGMIAIRAAMQQHPDRFVDALEEPMYERWGVTFPDEDEVGIVSEHALQMILERFGRLPDHLPVLKRWRESGQLVVEYGANGRNQHRKMIRVPGKRGLSQERVYLLKTRVVTSQREDQS